MEMLRPGLDVWFPIDKRVAADNRQLGVPEFGSILASRPFGVALTVDAVCYS
jgi:hypothetical protein